MGYKRWTCINNTCNVVDTGDYTLSRISLTAIIVDTNDKFIMVLVGCCSSVASALGCCKAALGSNLGRTPHGGPSRLSIGDENFFRLASLNARIMNKDMYE
jgi:hypothetical protein